MISKYVNKATTKYYQRKLLRKIYLSTAEYFPKSFSGSKGLEDEGKVTKITVVPASVFCPRFKTSSG